MYKPSSPLQSDNALAGGDSQNGEASRSQLAADLEQAFEFWPRPCASQQQAAPNAAMEASNALVVPTREDSPLEGLSTRYDCIEQCLARFTSEALATRHSFASLDVWSSGISLGWHVFNGTFAALVRPCSCRVRQSHIWGWLDPAADSALMPITYLTGAGAAIGRAREAVDAQHDAAVCAATSVGRQASQLYSMLG